MCGWCGSQLRPSPVDATMAVPLDGPLAGANGDDQLGHELEDDVGMLSIGTMLVERYRIDAVLGRGGFGITYRAWDGRLQRNIAIKELFPLGARRQGDLVVAGPGEKGAFDDALNRFRREAAALARFSHPGIVRVFEVLEANNTAYLIMELIEGASMADLLRDRGGPLEVDEVLDVVVRVSDALSAVHEAGLLHRDVNPSNIMLDGTRRVVLIDFGLARRYGDELSGALTRAVTPGYAPPEQYAGSARSGPTCDVFGLAATTYKLLTGVTPTNVFDRQAGAKLEAPSVLRPGLPSLVSAGVLDGMELDPAHRPRSAQAFVDRLGLHGVARTQPVLVTAHAAPVVDETRADDPGPPDVPAPLPQSWNGSPPVADLDRAWFASSPEPAIPREVVGSVPRDGVPPQVMALRAQPAPWHDGSAPVVGPPERWRGWVSWPGTIATVALVSASPILAGALVALVVLPVIATLGDIEVHRHRRRNGEGRTRWQRAPITTVVPIRFLRNLGVGLFRALPAVAVIALGVLVADTVKRGDTTVGVRAVVVRVTGLIAGLALVIPARTSGRHFRSDLGLTALAQWVMEGKTTPGTRTVVAWVLSVAAIAFAFWLGPEFWPVG